MKINRAGMWWGAILLLVLVPRGAFGETRYVSDVLVITVRSHPAASYETLTTLKTNEPLEVLGEEGEFTHVRTQDGLEGWVSTQYLTRETPKPIVISRLEREKSRLEARVKELEGSVETLKGELAQAKGRHRETLTDIEGKYSQTQAIASQTSKELATVTEKYNQLLEQSRDVVALAQERDGLRTANEGLTTEVAFLRQENERLSRTGMIRWFLAGAAVLVVGWMVGRASRKKKKYY